MNNQKIKFEKPSLTIDEQIRLLRERGLILDDEERLRYFLTNISYYHWSIYFKNFQKDDVFYENTNFEDILKIYVFDNKLRLLLLELLERVEKSFKCRIAYELSVLTGDSHCYSNSDLFNIEDDYEKAITMIREEVKKSREISITHYLNRYNQPELPPVWMIIEILSFGQCGKIHKTLKIEYRNIICRSFGIDEKYIVSWMHCLSNLRNNCAHHSRIWNRNFTFKPIIKSKQYGRFFNNNNIRLFNYLVVLQIILSKINPTSSWLDKMKAYIDEGSINIKSMGFPEDWEGRLRKIMTNYKI